MGRGKGRAGLLLLTDRPTEGRRLQQAVDAVEPCTLVTLVQPNARPAAHAAILCDVALDDPAAVALVQAVLARHRVPADVPVLHLSRRTGEPGLAQSQAIGATAVLPHSSTDAQVVFTVRRLIDLARAAPARVPGQDATLAGARDAAVAFAELFEAARQGRAIPPERVEQGGGAVMAAVAGGRIGAWLDIVRGYDDVTYQHCLLVAGLAAGFAARLGMTLRGQRLISQAALIHDIGKANIPHAIVNKVGRLDDAETAVMRKHPAVGHAMLVRQGGFDPQILDIVRHHHEAVDGSGYPDRLSGEAVTSLARLVTICDIYAALIERRTYKAPMPSAEAMAVLAGMGGKLDAGLLHAFGGLVRTAA